MPSGAGAGVMGGAGMGTGGGGGGITGPSFMNALANMGGGSQKSSSSSGNFQDQLLKLLLQQLASAQGAEFLKTLIGGEQGAAVAKFMGGLGSAMGGTGAMPMNNAGAMAPAAANLGGL